MPLYEGIGIINEKHPVVLEIGASFTKAGFAGESTPRCIIPSSINCKKDSLSKPKLRKLVDYQDEDDLYQMLVEFFHFIYCRHLLVTPKDRKVVVVDALFSKTKWRQVLAKVLYLHYEVLTVLWVPGPLASVCATGFDTALVVDIGTEEVQIIPVFRGVTLLCAVIAHELGAKAFDENLKELLLANCINKSAEELTPLLTERLVEDLRVRCCFVTNISRGEKLAVEDASSDSLSPKLKPFTYEFDGKNFIQFEGVVREKAAELWFQNNDLDGIALPVMILESLSKCPVDVRKELASSILITGGTGMIPGLKARLVRELKKVEASVETLNESKDDKFIEKFGNGSYAFKFYNPPVRENSVGWLGGAVYGATEAMNLRGVSKEFFLKNGLVPDWCNLKYDMVTGLSSSGISAYSSSNPYSKGL